MKLASEYSWLTLIQAGDPIAIGIIDETPVWSAPFGETLMAAIHLAPNLRVLDVGCGLGYPLLELAARLGPTARCVGLDPWNAALGRARSKAQMREHVVTFQEGIAEAIPFEANAFDLVISNNGLNNVADIKKALFECFRVAAPGAQFLMTANLPETFGTFYSHFEAALEAANQNSHIQALRDHRAAKRPPSDRWYRLVSEAGFGVAAQTYHTFSWHLLDGEALFTHPAFRLSFLPSWVEAVGEDIFETIRPDLLRRLDAHARDAGGLEMEIPFLLLEAEKP
ncbi:MAG: methyltransferase domain-containing protein [Holophaga sp.]|nr:methyltransferase domain-containing protein [Holophaga sp.]